MNLQLQSITNFRLSENDELCLNPLVKRCNKDNFIVMSSCEQTLMHFYEAHALTGLDRNTYRASIKRLIKFRIVCLIKTKQKEIIMVNPKYLDIDMESMTELQRFLYELFFIGNNVPIVFDPAIMKQLLTNEGRGL